VWLTVAVPHKVDRMPCHRQDFSYKNLCVNDLPTPVQSTVSEDRTENNKVL